MKIRIWVQRYSFDVIWKLRKSIFKTLFSWKKLFNLLLSRLSILLRLDRVMGYPPLVIIEPSGNCNLSCPMCARSQANINRKEGNMPLEDFKEFIDEAGNYMMFLMIFGYGEPLLNKDMFRMIEYAKRKNIFTIMSTNATLLNQTKIREMINSGLDYLVVSLDAATERTYKKIRRGGDFSKVLRNIKILTEERKGLGSSTPLVDIQVVAMKENESELDLIEDLSKELGADRFSIKKVALYKDYSMDRVEKFVPGNRDYSYDFYLSEGRIKNMFCNYPWKHTAINWNGDVVPCCKDVNSEHVLGNIFDEESFKNIWNGERYETFRRQIKEDIDKIEICRKCNKRACKEGYV